MKIQIVVEDATPELLAALSAFLSPNKPAAIAPTPEAPPAPPVEPQRARRGRETVTVGGEERREITTIMPNGEAKRAIGGARAGSTKSEAPQAPAEAPKAVFPPREEMIATLRKVVQSDRYEECERYLAKVGKETFLGMTDMELASAVRELMR